jgi:hypothetical protein
VIARDVARIFNFITGYAEPAELEKMAVSPVKPEETHPRPRRRRDRARQGGTPAAIWMKMNSLVDPEIIDALYNASRAASRSTCGCAASAACGPGVPACPSASASSRSSALPRAQPHLLLRRRARPAAPQSRDLHLSADMMPRNLDRRVEVLCPIVNATVHEQVLDQIMVANFKDNEQSWNLLPDGTSMRIKAAPGEEPFNAHKYFMTNPSCRAVANRSKSRRPAALRAAASALKRAREFRAGRSITAIRSPSSTSVPTRCAWSSTRADALADADLQRKGAGRPRPRGAVDRLLAADAVEKALGALRRFRALCDTAASSGCGASRPPPAATPTTGPSSSRPPSASARKRVAVLTGKAEAHYSALASFPVCIS